MSTVTFSIFSSIFGFVVAAISLFAFLVNICRSYLPSNRIKELESLMDETEIFFNKAVEDGLLIEPGFVQQTKCDLTMLRTITHGLQSRAYNATLYQDYLEFLSGTSRSIGSTCQSLKKLKAQVITSSEKGRSRRRMGENAGTNSSPSSALSLTLHFERHPNPLLFAQTRPRSCPPVLSGQRGGLRGSEFADILACRRLMKFL
ncbi:hypothetical protein JVT61DRAFT_9994 [Boletus reticuloceps]|uniref:Uncharacterized protein n=1 Tax=Boletus reticuloceps TaxID=495285 RepID=A0A8I3ADI6_9AGAM|nr:hypothetical protein JVT61DRAFT_9994 [Boletus reticuloceps]